MLKHVFPPFADLDYVPMVSSEDDLEQELCHGELTSIILEQRLSVFPTRQRSHSSYIRLNHIVQTASRPVTKDGPLHVGGFDLASAHLDLAITPDQALRDVD